jgi:hypothetical protein
MKSLNNDLLFDNLSVTELEERLEMVALTAALDAGGSHSCSSLDCVQHAITRAEELSVQQAVQAGQITAVQASQITAQQAQLYLVR